jgi:hypothetical protein
MIVSVNLAGADKALARIGRGHKLPFLIVTAINKTGEAVQKAEKEHVRAVLTIRKPFIPEQVKLFRARFSTDPKRESRWEARVGIGIGARLTGSPLLLPRFETGGVRGGTKGGGVAIPVVGGARPSQEQLIPDPLFIKRLQLRRIPRGRRRKGAAPSKGKAVRQGLLDTYMVPGVGIFQRKGQGFAASRLLYSFKPTVRLPKVLRFYAVARRVIKDVFAREVQRQVNDSFARHG